jgi:D-glycero-alpha-D-manno-heptose-7-phosphate kinase
VRIETSAPTRIDLAGGTIDIWPLYLFHDGAQTLNAAISLRARARIETRDDARVVIRSADTGRAVEVDDWTELRERGELRLLALLTHWFLRGPQVPAHGRKEGLTLTTSSESPAGAGIGGSSALNVAVCAALATWTRHHREPEALLEIAMNVEAQAINIPTGLQDYRPAMYGGIAALELGVDGVHRVPLDVDAQALQRRIVLCYTGESRNSGTNNWEIIKKHIDGDRHVFDCFERIRDTAATMREALARGEWDRVGAAIGDEWESRKRLAPGVTTPAIDDLIARARAAGATAAKVCGAGGGGCLFCYGSPERAADIKNALTAGGARVLEYRIERDGLTRG